MNEKTPQADLTQTPQALGGGINFSPAGVRDTAEKVRGDKPETVVVMAGSQYMGKGDDKLGAKLAVIFFDTMAAVGHPPAVMTFYNTGVFLTTQDGPILEALKELAAQGASLISSSVCLDFFNLKDQVKVGRVGDMYEIIKAHRMADRIIRL